MTRGVPAVLVTGVSPQAMAASTIALQWDLPNAVVMHHVIDVEAQQLHRVVSDITGVIDRHSVDLAHACVACAVREDIVPMLIMLGELGRWDTIVAHLPVGAEASQVCRSLSLRDTSAVRVAGVVAAVDGPGLADDLTGDVLLEEIGRHTADDDRRGVAEALGAIVEYADVIAVQGDSQPEGIELLRAIARPDVTVVGDASMLPSGQLAAGAHDHARTEAWVAELRRDELPPIEAATVWRLDLTSERPFHPERLHERLEEIGGGAHRSRGCFWLPTRPGTVCAWDGAGGQVSIGSAGTFGLRPPLTRIVVTGLVSRTSEAERAEIQAAFEACLCTADELADRGRFWGAASDGLEDWLGDIRAVA